MCTFAVGGPEKRTWHENGFGAHARPKPSMSWDFWNSYKVWSPRIAGSTKKSARHGRQDANFVFFATPPGRERDCKKSYIFKMFFDGFQKYENFDAFFAHLKHSERLTFWNCKIGARQTLRSLLFREQRRLPLGRCLKSWNSHSYGRRTNFFLCSAPSVGMPLLPSDENPWARIAILMVTKSWNCKKNVALTWVWRVAILKISSAKKLSK